MKKFARKKNKSIFKRNILNFGCYIGKLESKAEFLFEPLFMVRVNFFFIVNSTVGTQMANGLSQLKKVLNFK